jgi:hypothetical protein
MGLNFQISHALALLAAAARGWVRAAGWHTWACGAAVRFAALGRCYHSDSHRDKFAAAEYELAWALR